MTADWFGTTLDCINNDHILFFASAVILKWMSWNAEQTVECYRSCGDLSHGCMCTHSHTPPKTAQFYSINQCHFPFLGSCSPVPYSIILLTRSAFLPLMGKSIATLNRFHNQFFYYRSTKLLPGFENGNTLKERKKRATGWSCLEWLRLGCIFHCM